MLAVNHESRDIMLKSYVVVADDSGPRLYYCAERDTLWVAQDEYPDDWAILAVRLSKSSGVQVTSLATQYDGGLYQPEFAELVVRLGIRRLFLVSREGKRMRPRVWPLAPRTRENNGIDTMLYMEGPGDCSVRRQFERLEKEEPGDGVGMRSVTVVEKGLWEEEGLQLVDQEFHEVIMGEAFSISLEDL